VKKTKQYSWDKKPKADTSSYTFTSASSNKTTTRDYKSISGNAVSISNVKNGTIMISDHIGGAIVDDCSESKLFLGASSESVFIRDCKDMIIYSICTQFRIRDCHNLKIILHCESRPAIESCTNIKLHPWNVNFKKIEDVMQDSSVKRFTNSWHNVHIFDENTPLTLDAAVEVCSQTELEDGLGSLEQTEKNLYLPVVNGKISKASSLLIIHFDNKDERNKAHLPFFDKDCIFRSWEGKPTLNNIPASVLKDAETLYTICLEIDSEMVDKLDLEHLKYAVGEASDAQMFFSSIWH